MSFGIDRITEDQLNILRLQDKITGTTISILPDHGALLHGFEIPLNGRRINIIDNYAGKADLERFLHLSYKSAKLSPFACRIPGGTYSFDEITYEFANRFQDGSAIHGLLANKPFNLVDQLADDNMAAVRLRYQYKKDDAGFPFNYMCEVKYSLHPDNALQVETTVTNLTDGFIPMSDGWHPYFRLGGKVDQYQLQFRSDTLLEFDEKLIPTGNTVFDDSFLYGAELGSRHLDNCFLLDNEEGTPCCILYNPENQLRIAFYVNARYPYLQIYTPDDRESIAIENLSAAPNSFNNGMGLIRMSPRQTLTFSCWYQASIG
ncbi:aldose 1-epimerase [Pseudoflavitalea sp. G-6-1-2]|uniref:aldose 1-epimerase n=1 Tax=Pseudoflavitalea sp. G-6-1-2 TaxID=2728841 RepID=UPI00146A9578|nr:aldose 1-epimerase [Pseudoflavitalea sp. G-6-1-2]NML19700.1 aldose 1-epimerase [Pseudoflavitalea sp. G-6-1-2]